MLETMRSRLSLDTLKACMSELEVAMAR